MTLEHVQELHDLAGADIDEWVRRWVGLPVHVTLGSAANVMEVDLELEHDGVLGEAKNSASYASAHSDRYAGGIRLWSPDQAGIGFPEREVQLVEGRHPIDPNGDLVEAPDLGIPDATLSARLGLIDFEDGELVYAGRGLALRINPESRVLLSVLGFGPTSVEDYLNRLRPVDKTPHPVLAGGSA